MRSLLEYARPNKSVWENMISGMERSNMEGKSRDQKPFLHGAHLADIFLSLAPIMGCTLQVEWALSGLGVLIQSWALTYRAVGNFPGGNPTSELCPTLWHAISDKCGCLFLEYIVHAIIWPPARLLSIVVKSRTGFSVCCPKSSRAHGEQL